MKITIQETIGIGKITCMLTHLPISSARRIIIFGLEVLVAFATNKPCRRISKTKLSLSALIFTFELSKVSLSP